MNAIFNFMKNNYKVIIMVIAVSAILWSFMPKNMGDPERDKTLIALIKDVIDQGHYNPASIDDNFSKGVYKDYLDALDPNRRFFLESDITEFKMYETKIDNMINNPDLTFFNLTAERLKKRIQEAKVVYKSMGDKAFDFTNDEVMNIDSDKLLFAKNYNELKSRWRLGMKLTVLSAVTDKIKIEDEKKLKDPAYKKKTIAELEKDSRISSVKSLNEYFDFLQDTGEEGLFVAYINAIVTQFDPHTSYFAPEQKESFDISMSGKLEGIGARLQKKNEFTEISELISGGPAWQSKELEPGDLILKVAQGNAEPIDVVGMRLDDVVKKIKGKRGTQVKLTIKKVDGSIKIISLIRDIVEIEETYAKSSVIEKEGKKYGVIYLPKFYIDFENDNNRDAAKDVAIEVDQLKKYGVDGIIMDLRDDGGGSLKTVVDIAGLFIEQGPIVQIKSERNKEVLFDRDSKIQWDGPLVVLVNNFSASASEIFAAAIQDYNRGIIMGSKQTYGKGTVQNVIDLNQLIQNNKLGDLGALKITTQKFYRVNGGSTQMEGVVSDISMPDRYSYIKIGERDSEHAMPWDKIESASFEPLKKISNYDAIVTNSKKRIAENNQFQLIDESAKWINDRKEDNLVSLNMVKFQKEQSTIDDATKKFKAITTYKNQLKFSSLPKELTMIKKDSVLGRKRKDWHDIMAKDVYINEAVNVLGDMKKAKVVVKGNVVGGKKDKIVKS
jgi:carboxyl-terminal processing protease